jgi:hypothetical protein
MFSVFPSKQSAIVWPSGNAKVAESEIEGFTPEDSFI